MEELSWAHLVMLVYVNHAIMPAPIFAKLCPTSAQAPYIPACAHLICLINMPKYIFNSHGLSSGYWVQLLLRLHQKITRVSRLSCAHVLHLLDIHPWNSNRMTQPRWSSILQDEFDTQHCGHDASRGPDLSNMGRIPDVSEILWC